MPDLRPILLVIGIMLAGLGAAMFAPMAVDLANESSDWKIFALSGALTMVVGSALALANRTDDPDLGIRGAFLLTTLSWVTMAIFSAIPFYLANINMNLTDSLFEAVSGITTTGSTVIVGLDNLPKGILLWRAILQWIGGIGIIVTALAILPMLRVGGMELFRLESSDMSEKTLPRAGEIAALIAVIYLLLTFACALGYIMTGMSGFDAVAHAMTTVATGGYSTSDASLGGFMRGGADIVAIFFMLAGSLPFVVYMSLTPANFKPGQAWRDPQMRAFLGVVGVAILIVTTALWLVSDMSEGEALRLAAFNAISIITGTGYATADYMTWGQFCIALFFVFMFIGGCAGSTTCSVKIFRYQVTLQALRAYLFKMPRPRAVATLRYGGKPMPEKVVFSVLGFMFLFFACFAVSAVILSLMGLDPMTAWSGAGSSIANVGPGLGDIIGPSGTYESLPDKAKWVLMFNMLLGRLEIVAALVLFTPNFWRA